MAGAADSRLERNPVTLFSNGGEAESAVSLQIGSMVERNAPLKTDATDAAKAIPLSIGAALEIARRAITRLGLSATHKVHALYAGGDRQTEGAAFAVIVRPLPKLPSIRTSSAIRRYKLLIFEDGNSTIRMVGSPQPA